MANGSSKRFTRRFRFNNKNREYEDILVRKRINHINQYSTPFYKRLSQYERRSLTIVPHIWKTGDRYYKLAHTYYGKPELWWVIAQYNGMPTEGMVFRGDVIYIPTPIELYLKYL